MSKNDDPGEPKPIYKKVWFWGLSVLIVLTTIGIIRGPGNQDINYKQAGVAPPAEREAKEPEPAKQAVEAPSDQPVTCDSPEAAQMVKSALEGSSNALQQVEVLDFGRAKESFYQPEIRARGCRAIAELSTGGGMVTYQLYFGPSGKALVQVQQGKQAEMQAGFDQDRAAEIAARDRQAGSATETSPAQNEVSPAPKVDDADDGNGPQDKSQ